MPADEANKDNTTEKLRFLKNTNAKL